uniref:Reverse transcriptase zinc-binding domain-containing protein n=1 Tax=Neolamprologus brichardi TaxID=32507 RepID=A0A3Q4HHP4_NEOBR
MNTLPKFIYLFQCLPTNVPKRFFKELNKIMTSFIWQKKNPRVKLSSLQAPYSRGGLNLPNFRNYYLASQYRSIWIWLHAERSEVNPIPLKDLTNNLIILNTFSTWQGSHSRMKINISFLRRTPLWGNPGLSHHIEKLPDHNKASIKRKWETDLGYVYEEVEWHHLLEQAQTMLITTKHRQMQFNILHRIYYTPYRQHKIDSNYSPRCLRCKVTDGDLLHMLWNCPVIEEFWRGAIEIISKCVGSALPQAPLEARRTAILLYYLNVKSLSLLLDVCC